MMSISMALHRLTKPVTFRIPQPGSYVDGRWVEPAPVEQVREAVVLPMSAEDLRLDTAGHYTAQDLKVILSGERLPIGTRLTHEDGEEYEIRECRDYQGVAGVSFHVARRVMKGE